jgi:hypothetical protein
MDFDVYFLNNTKEVDDNIVTLIDEENFMELKLGSATRLDLFMYAMALGKDAPSPLANRKSFVRGEDLRRHDDDIALMTALKYSQKEDYESLEDNLKDKDIAILAEEAANMGFKIIESYIETRTGENAYMKYIEDLDDLYEKNVESF